MPELRHDPILDRWVVVAAERAERPHTFGGMERPNRDRAPNCPFCPGNEHQTTPEELRTGTGDPNTPGWRIRVFPNMYPIAAGGATRRNDATDPWRDTRPSTGAHEVALMSPVHRLSFADLDDEDAVAFFTVLRDRALVHEARGHTYTQLLVNHGTAAGASIEHPHAQIISVDFVPEPVEGIAQRGLALGRPVVEVAREREAGGPQALVVHDRATAWVPWAGATPYITYVAPNADCARLNDARDSDVAAVALACRDVLRLARAELGEQPYNLMVTSAANGDDRPFQWFVEIQPRLLVIAGFELGAHVYVNVVAPEVAAAQLRSHLPVR